MKDKRVLIVSSILEVLGIGGTVWLDSRNRINPANIPDLNGLKREGSIFMVGVLKWVILLILIVIGLLLLPHILSLFVYIIRRCWKSLKMTYDGIREGFSEDEDREDDSEEVEKIRTLGAD